MHLNQPYEQLAIHHASPYEVVAWQFVVTKSGAIPVAATVVEFHQGLEAHGPQLELDKLRGAETRKWQLPLRRFRRKLGWGQSIGRVHLGLPVLSGSTLGWASVPE